MYVTNARLALSTTVARHCSLYSCNTWSWGRSLTVAFCPSSTCELSEAVANIVLTHHQSESYPSVLTVGWEDDSVSHTHPALTKRWRTCRRHVQTVRGFVGNAFYTVSGKASSYGTSSNTLVRILFTTSFTVSPIVGARSRTSSRQFSFRNVFMLSPEQKMVHVWR